MWFNHKKDDGVVFSGRFEIGDGVPIKTITLVCTVVSSWTTTTVTTPILTVFD